MSNEGTLRVAGDGMGAGVLGVGRANIDINAVVSDEFLASHSLPKGRGKPVSAPEFDRLRAGCRVTKICTGGSVANTIATLADAGIQTSLFCRLGADEFGRAFAADFQARSVRLLGLPARQEDCGQLTGRCLVLITPDGERSFAFHAGVAEDISTPPVFDGAALASQFLVFEGNIISSRANLEALRLILQQVKTRNQSAKIVLSLHDCGGDDGTSILPLLQEAMAWSDIIIGNQDEVDRLNASFDQHNAGFRALDKTLIVTHGINGVSIKTKGGIDNVPATRTPNVIDTVGAGDSFLGGLLFGLLSHRPLVDAAHVGTIWAARALAQLGGRPSLRGLE